MELVFVHGALVRDGEWWWHRTAELLAEQTGVASRAVLLPSCGEAPPHGQLEGLRADAQALVAVLDELEDAVVVAHSYGGTVLAEAGAHRAVRHRVYVSSYLPDVGQSQSGVMSAEPDGVAVVPVGDGTVRVDGYDASSFGARFLHDADEAAQHAGWERVTAQSLTSFTTPTTQAGWTDGESTYLVCTDDRSTTVGLQRAHAALATRTVDLPTGHHPFVSRPDLVVDQLTPIVRAPRA